MVRDAGIIFHYNPMDGLSPNLLLRLFHRLRLALADKPICHGGAGTPHLIFRILFSGAISRAR